MLPTIIALSIAGVTLCVVCVFQHLRIAKADEDFRRLSVAISNVTKVLRQAEKRPPSSPRPENPYLAACWQTLNCERKDCPAHGNSDLRCWLLTKEPRQGEEGAPSGVRLQQCASCEVYRRARPDAVWNLLEQLSTIMSLLERDRVRLADSERRAEQAGKLATLGEFAAGIAHEINNPLDGIVSCLSRLERDPANLRQNIEYLNLMREALERMAAAVQHILAYSRRRDPNLAPVDVHAVIEDMVPLVKASARQNALSIRLEFGRDVPLVLADRYYLSEAFLNLASNAMAATTAGGTLTFRTRLAPEESSLTSLVEIDVIDNGAGIQPQDLPRIFEPFFTTKGPGKGTGLGLAIVKHIVEEHGGRIRVDSAPQAGATVRVFLPTAPLSPSLPTPPVEEFSDHPVAGHGSKPEKRYGEPAL